jgi:hypothetical protein
VGCAVSEDPKFIYIHIPKTGGTSLFSQRSSFTKQLYNYADMTVMAGHRPITAIKPESDLVKYLKFCCCRNPYDRLVSLWKIRYSTLTFDNFIDNIGSNKIIWYPLRSQLYWVVGRDGSLLVDAVARFEDLQNSLERILSWLDIPPLKIPHLRKTKNRNRSYLPYYKDQSMLDAVYSIYKEDFEAFNYQREEL